MIIVDSKGQIQFKTKKKKTHSNDTSRQRALTASNKA